MSMEMEAQVEEEKRDTICGLTLPKSFINIPSYGLPRWSCEFPKIHLIRWKYMSIIVFLIILLFDLFKWIKRIL